MVVKPQELATQVTNQEAPIVERLEQRIDAVLTERFQGRGTVTIDYDADFRRLRQCTLNNLLDKYRQKGWTTAKVVHDQRDGSYVQFMYNPSATTEAYWRK